MASPSPAAARRTTSPRPGVPASPATPDRWYSVSATSAGSRPASVTSHSTAPGSTEPDRVAMTRPSSGVNPMVVSIERPSRTAHSDAPAPRWQTTIRPGRAPSATARPAAYSWDRPWNP